MSSEPDDFVIHGITTSGNRFRPSDWAERLCGMMSIFGADQRMKYSPYVRPMTVDGIKCVLVHAKLREVEPAAYSFLKSFARDNELQVRPAQSAEGGDAGAA